MKNILLNMHNYQNSFFKKIEAFSSNIEYLLEKFLYYINENEEVQYFGIQIYFLKFEIRNQIY